MKERIENSGGEVGRSEWERLTEFEEVQANERAESTEKLGELGREYRKVERDFKKEMDAKSNRYAEDPKKQEEYNRFIIEKYESRIRENRFLARINADFITNPYYLAGIEKLSIDRPEDTVEAKSGIMYGKRLADLRKSILDGEGEDAQKEADIKRVGETLGLVLDHISYQYQRPKGEMESRMSDVHRTESHNKMIDQLNWLNEKAEERGVKRFTCRDFITSRGYDRTRDAYGEYGRRMKDDRMIVEKYFDVAFGERVDRMKRTLEREAEFY